MTPAEKKEFLMKRATGRRTFAADLLDGVSYNSGEDGDDLIAMYSRAKTLGLSEEDVNDFLDKEQARRERQTHDQEAIGAYGRVSTEYGTKGDGSYYAKRDEAARKRNAAQAGNRGATKTRGLDRHAELQGTPTGYSHSGSRDKRKLESEEGRAERYARRAARKGDQATASRVRTASFAKELKHPTPNIKSEEYRAQEEANRRRILEDARRRQEISDKSRDVYSDLLDRIKQRRYEETK